MKLDVCDNVETGYSQSVYVVFFQAMAAMVFINRKSVSKSRQMEVL